MSAGGFVKLTVELAGTGEVFWEINKDDRNDVRRVPAVTAPEDILVTEAAAELLRSLPPGEPVSVAIVDLWTERALHLWSDGPDAFYGIEWPAATDLVRREWADRD